MNFDIKDIKSWANRHDVKVGDKGYVSSNLHSLQEDLKNNVALIREISHICDDVYCFSCKAFGNIRSYGLFLPLEKVKKTDKPKSTENRKTFDSWIANKVKVRVVTTAIDYDNTFFSILGVIEKCEKQGILLKDQNDKEQFICYPNILEVQYLGTDDWSEYEEPDIAEILNRPC